MDFGQITLFENKNIKSIRSDKYNFDFNKKTGLFRRWGETFEDDPSYAPSPEILDMEISTICEGIGSGPCKWCYKSNTKVGENMSFEKFKTIFHKITGSKIRVTLENGDIKEFYPDEVITLKDNTTKKACDLLDDDII